MATYLVTLTIGPVQSLIDSARRTRDLWCGSWLLAESAKAAALALHTAQPDCLIFPRPDKPEEELAPSDRPKDKDANIANILRAQIDLPDDTAVRTLLAKAKQAATERLACLCDQARRKISGLPFHDDLWSTQKQDILESFAAWVEVKGDNYQSVSKRLGGLLATRKATRDFAPAAKSADDKLGFGIPKSSLDGARESVIKVSRDDRRKGKCKTALRKLGVTGGEELDALAVAKRMAGSIDQFTAYSRIAADAWVEALAQSNPAALESIRLAYEPLVAEELATRVKGNNGIYSVFPYDAQLVFGFRLENALSDAIDDKERTLLKKLREAKRNLDEPVPYAVILKADGDRMGELLGKAKTVEESRNISRSLHDFAKTVRHIVCQHRGHAIYAGGDDVMALLPLENAVTCAAALAKAFKRAMNEAAAVLDVAPDARPTLSVGLGIGHLMEPLGRLRARADAAEKLAKGNGTALPRNALAIKLGIRSGVEMNWRCNWNVEEGEPQDCDGIQVMQKFVKAYRTTESKQCPSRLGYDLSAIARRLSWAKNENEALPGIHAAELTRTLERARQQGGDGELSAELKHLVEGRGIAVGLVQLADELIIARWLSARTKSDIGVLE